MRLPEPALQIDPILDIQEKRVVVKFEGRSIRGTLISFRDGFLCLEPLSGPRISINKFELSSIILDCPRQSRKPKLSRLFWKRIIHVKITRSPKGVTGNYCYCKR